MWDPINYGNIDMIQVSIHDVWVPKIVIDNTVDYHSLYKMDNYFDSKMTFVTFTNDGSAFFFKVPVFGRRYVTLTSRISLLMSTNVIYYLKQCIRPWMLN